MSAEKDGYYDCSFVSIHYIICECGETFPTENGLKAHLEKEHPHKRERKEFKCGVCGSTFDSEDECITHYEDTHIVGEVKQEEYSDEEAKPDISDMSEMPVVTSEPETEEIIQEEVIEDENFDGQTLHIPEEYGQMVQMSEGQLVLLVSKSPRKPGKKPKSQNPRKRIPRDIVCEVCGKKYASKAALKYHQRVHTGERPYRCHLCPKGFTMPLFLQIHVRTHTGERPYACPHCPKAFSNKAALLRHDRVHTGVKPYACPMCLKTFTQSNSMKLHVTTVHLKQPAPYKSKSRRLKAAERLGQKAAARSKKPVEIVPVTVKMDTEEQQPDCEDEDSVYEVIESEEVGGELPDGDCYEVIYDS